MELAVKPLVAVLAAALAAAGIAVATIPAQAQGTVLKGEVVEDRRGKTYSTGV